MFRVLWAVTFAAVLLAGCGRPCDCPTGDTCDANDQCVASTGGGAGGGSGGAGGGGGSCGADTWTNYASQWFRTTCSNCHGSEFGTYQAVKGVQTAITGEISSQAMPPGGGLSNSERQRILSWFGCAMPQ